MRATQQRHHTRIASRYWGLRHLSCNNAPAASSAFQARLCSVDASMPVMSSDATTTAVVDHDGAPLKRLRLAVVRPDLLDDWIVERNSVDAQHIQCTDATTKIWWRCSLCRENYDTTVSRRVALGSAACPHCQGRHAPAEAREDSAAATSAPTLAAAHPELLHRWDDRRNGGLLPTQVLVTSRLSVWWLPVSPDTSAEAVSQSFQRPIYMFINDTLGPMEKEAATGAMELKLLRRIHNAARISEAEHLGSFPTSLYHLDAVEELQSPSNRHDASISSSLASEDIHSIIALWKPTASRLLKEAAETAVLSQPHHQRVGIRPKWHLKREVFTFTTPLKPSMVAAAARTALLHRYTSFVMKQRRNGASEKARRLQAMAPNPILDLSAKTPLLEPTQETATDKGQGSIGAISSSWLDFFKLSAEQIQPLGHISAEAELRFAYSALDSAVTRNGSSGGSDEAALVSTTVVSSGVRRRRSYPTFAKDGESQANQDAARAVKMPAAPLQQAVPPPPPSSSVPYRSGDALKQRVGISDAPFGQKAVSSLEMEYDDDDAEESEKERRRSTLPPLPQHSSLISASITALGEAPAAPSIHQELQYSRSVHAPPLAMGDDINGNGTASATPPSRGRRTAARPRLRFLQTPAGENGKVDDGATAVSAQRAVIGEGGPAAMPPSFEAPATPRRVARPRRRVTETTSESPTSSPSTEPQ